MTEIVRQELTKNVNRFIIGAWRNLMTDEMVHITADIPRHLRDEVDDLAKKLERSRSFAVRKGLSLFLAQYRQELSENDKIPDKPQAEEVAIARK